MKAPTLFNTSPSILASIETLSPSNELMVDACLLLTDKTQFSKL